MVDACAGPPCPEKPESKNPGGIPNVAAEAPLCPLLSVCQVPVLPLVWLPGSPAGLVLGAKLIHGVLAHGFFLRPLQWVKTHSRYLQRICTNSRSQHQSWALWPCHAKHWGRPCVQVAPISIPAGALAEPPGFTVVSGEVLGLIGAGPLIFTSSDLKRSLHKLSQQTCRSFTDHSNLS